MIKLGIQGEPGSFSNLAANKLFTGTDHKFELSSYKSFPELTKGLDSGAIDLALMPIENSIAGSILGNFDLLTNHDLLVLGEAYLRIQMCLIGLPEAELKDVKTVYSHEMAIKQCQVFIVEHDLEAREYYDTAGSVLHAKELNDKSVAGIAANIAAEQYGLKVIQAGIETDKSNYTRFVLLSTKENIAKYDELVAKIEAASEDPHLHKVMVEFKTEHKPGALMHALRVLANAQVNLTKIESRPILGESWNYRFYVDFVSEKGSGEIEKILADLETHTTFLKVLGKFSPGKTYQP